MGTAARGVTVKFSPVTLVPAWMAMDAA